MEKNLEITALKANHPEHFRRATALRVLAIDAVQAANSGHPGMPMGMADVATVLFEKHLKFSAQNPNWPDRDRFVLSAGHGSMLLYALLFLTGYEDIQLKDPDFDYSKLLSDYVHRGVEHGYLSEDLLKFDLVRLSKAIKCDRDNQFSFFGLQTLYDRYFIHHKGTRIEMPQILFMRVAMGLALKEEQREQRAIEFYEVLSNMTFVSSTPTLFNSGTLHSQMSSCYINITDDSLKGIFKLVFSVNSSSSVIVLKNLSIDSLLNTANKLVHFGWKKEAIPVTQPKKSVIARFFDAIFG